MSTSLHDGRILQQIDLVGGSSLNSMYVRDVVQNNLSHYADQFGQVLVNWTRLGTAFGGPSPYTWSMNQTLRFGPFSLKLRQNGAPYKLRIRVASSRVSGSSTARYFTVTVDPFKRPAEGGEVFSNASALLYTSGFAAIAAGAANYNAVLRTPAITGSTVAWQNSSTLGTSGTLSNMIEIPPEFASGLLTSTPTPESISGGSASVEQALVYVCVAPDPASIPGTVISLDALYVAEYIGL